MAKAPELREGAEGRCLISIHCCRHSSLTGQWDLPGGGREGDESPIDCALREVEEEFGIRIGEDGVSALRRYPAERSGALDTYFCVARISPHQLESIRFGDEGQGWMLMDVGEFIAREDAAPHLRQRLEQHLSDT